MARKLYYRFGALFFALASSYFMILIWKSYVWWKWLNQLQRTIDSAGGGVVI